MRSKLLSDRFCPENVRGRTATFRLVLLALLFLALFLALFVLAQQFAVGIEPQAPFFAILVNDSVVILSLFLPAKNFAAFGLRLRSGLHCGRYIRTADV